MRLIHSALAIGLTAMVAAPRMASAEDWPTWRGPNHDGISSETGFKKTWTEPLKLLWERKLGPAFSGISCVGEQVYTCGTANEQQVLYCLQADSGSIIWQTPFEQEYKEAQGGDGSRSTPVIDDGRVYVLGAWGRLICCDAKTGKIIWDESFNKPPQWGYSGSVLIEGDMAVVSPGAPVGSLAAYNKATGEKLWTCGEDSAGYATPYPFDFNSKRYIVGFTGTAAIIAEARTGREVWSMPWETSYNVNAASPIVDGDHLFLSSGYRHGAILLKMRPEGDRIATTPVWESRVIRNKFQSSVLYEGHLYTSDEQALKCVEFLTGQEKWTERSIKNSTLIIADGYMLLLSEQGEFIMAPAIPDSFNPTTRAQMLSYKSWTVPTLYRGRLYARDLDRTVCFDLSGR